MITYSPDFFDLCYHGTYIKIMLGDYVEYSTWFGLKKVKSRVCYIPGISPPHKEMGDTEKSSLWAIEYGNNDIIQMLYVIDDKFVTKRIKFIARSDDNYKCPSLDLYNSNFSLLSCSKLSDNRNGITNFI